MASLFYYMLGYGEAEIQANPESIRIRHEMHKQIRNSHIKLRKVKSVEIDYKTVSKPIPIPNKKQKKKHKYIQ